MKLLIIRENEAGQRLDKYLAKLLEQAPKGFIYKMLRKKNIVLNGKKAMGKEMLQVEDQVKLFLSDETMEKFGRKSFQKVRGNLDVIYENQDVILINKPAGLLSQKGQAADVSLVEMIISYLLEKGELTQEELQTFRPGICNRLDRNTSGLVVGGKTLKGLQELSSIIASRELKKYYICLAGGKVEKPSKISGYLYKNERTNKVTVVQKPVEQARPIETEYTPLDTNGKVSLIKVHLITGRTHQIRSHLSSIGHPLIGDAKYGSLSLNREYKKKYGVNHQLLHAWELEFPKKEIDRLGIKENNFYAPLPEEFCKVIQGEHLNSFNL